MWKIADGRSEAVSEGFLLLWDELPVLARSLSTDKPSPLLPFAGDIRIDEDALLLSLRTSLEEAPFD